MKTLWIVGLWSLLSIVAYNGIAVALGVGGAAEPVAETRASRFIAALPPSLDEYVFLHETRNASMSLQVAARANACH